MSQNANAVPSNDPIQAFKDEVAESISTYKSETDWQKTSAEWMKKAFEKKYMYNFTALGRPIIQTPIDMVATQEVIWQVKPDLIIETGIAHGGSLILSASVLAMIAKPLKTVKFLTQVNQNAAFTVLILISANIT